jgi:hypothetical protein
LDQLDELDGFLQGILYSKRYRLGIKLRAKLAVPQLKLLKRISFRAGYHHRVTARFQPDRIASITEAWRYE